jgi:hypothetical protein
MSRLLSSTQKDAATEGVAAEKLFVDGIPYQNSAAKFWTALADEALKLYGPGVAVELTVLSSVQLTRKLLFPHLVTEEDLADVLGRPCARALAELAATLDLIGPPGSVTVRAYRGFTEFHRSALPADCLDGETFPYVIVWLVEWAGIPPARWNGEEVSGEIEGEDVRAKRLFRLPFTVRRSPAAEGLDRLSVSLQPAIRGA